MTPSEPPSMGPTRVEFGDELESLIEAVGLLSDLFGGDDGDISAGEAMRINSGGGQVRVDNGDVFGADVFFQGGEEAVDTRAVPTIEGTAGYYDVFLSERVDESGDGFFYRMELPVSGVYNVTLFFTEPWFTAPRQRVFDVNVNGQAMLQNYDIYAEAGGVDVAVSEARSFTITSGSINVEFRSIIDAAMVNAVQVVLVE